MGRMPVARIRQNFITTLLFCVALVCGGLLGRPAQAQVGSDRYASIVVDAASGTILSAANADEYRFPASLTKMMTIYLLFESLRDHRIALTDQVPVSPWASSMPPTKLGLMPGFDITVEQALLGLVTKSANDAAAALGELMGGDEERFAQMMTLRARALGMSHTTFRNASGLPDWEQVTTARDMAILARHLIQDFPQYYHYFSTPAFQFHGRTVMSHQHMLQTYPGADGLKTGYTEAAGYNVVTSALRGDTRLIGVVMGAASGGERDLHMASLLDQGFLREGVPIEIARRDPPAFRAPFIGTANAAPYFRNAPMQVAEAVSPRYRGRGPVELRPVAVRRMAEPFPLRARQAGLRLGPAIAQPILPREASLRARGELPYPARLRPTRTAHGTGSWRTPG
jgi:D-alanyl-D-alanine carboxypeptidase